jgi:hypothetical protein
MDKFNMLVKMTIFFISGYFIKSNFILTTELIHDLLKFFEPLWYHFVIS